MAKDYYKILGVDKNATEDQIKKAYRKAAVKWHPDRWTDKSEKEKKNAEEKFKEAAEANEVLSDPDKRARYDQFGENWDQMNGGFSSGFDIDIDDIIRKMHGGHSPFEDFFGRSNNQNRGPQPGQTVQMKYEIGIDEIFNGLSKEIEITVQGRCKDCNGTGGESQTCKYCNGKGMITQTQYTAFGMMSNSSPCPHCHGTGKLITKKCNKCNGTGRISIKRKIKLNINPFVRNGSTLKYTGMGYESHDQNGVNGDLIIQVIYNIDNSKYNIVGNNVYEKLEIPYYDCILGCEKEVILPNHKKEKITIKSQSIEGDNVILNGKGINGGNYIYVISPKLPSRSITNKISDKEKELLNKIKKLHK